MADYTSEIAQNSELESTPVAISSEVGTHDITPMTGAYETEIVEVHFRSIPLIFRSGAYSREIPIFNRSNP